MPDEPQIRREYRIKRVRTSISVPEDVDAWVRWKADKEAIPYSTVYALAINRWAEQLAAENGQDSPDASDGG